MSATKKQIRARFRQSVFERDCWRCVVCGEAGDESSLDAHHIQNRNDLPNGGYVPENGITLCKAEGGCHEKAEACLHDVLKMKDRVYGPDALYALIRSSPSKAFAASRRLCDD